MSPASAARWVAAHVARMTRATRYHLPRAYVCVVGANVTLWWSEE